MDQYLIRIMGEDWLEGTVVLSDSEYAAFMKVVNALEADGAYAPDIRVRNLSAEKREQEEQAKKEREQLEEMQSHIGKYSCKDIFAQAMTLFN